MPSEERSLWTRFWDWERSHPQCEKPLVALILIAFLPVFVAIGFAVVKLGDSSGSDGRAVTIGVVFWLFACGIAAWTARQDSLRRRKQ